MICLDSDSESESDDAKKAKVEQGGEPSAKKAKVEQVENEKTEPIPG